MKDLPNTVCPAFIDKMEEANLSSLPLRAPSRPALTAKALQCLTDVHSNTSIQNLLIDIRSIVKSCKILIKPFSHYLWSPGLYLQYECHILSPGAHMHMQQQPKVFTLLLQGTNVSTLSFEDVSRLGQFLCELPPSQVRLMAPDVINETLQHIASCQYIPRRHREDLIQLIKQIFG